MVKVTEVHLKSMSCIVNNRREKAKKYPEVYSASVEKIYDDWKESRTDEQVKSGEASFDFFVTVYDEYERGVVK